MKMNLICMNMNMLAEHISRTHVWFRTKTRFDTGNRQLGVGLSLCSHCSFLLVQPTTKKIIISLHSRFSGEHDIGVYFTLISPLLSWLHNCDDQSCLHIFPAVQVYDLSFYSLARLALFEVSFVSSLFVGNIHCMRHHSFWTVLVWLANFNFCIPSEYWE